MIFLFVLVTLLKLISNSLVMRWDRYSKSINESQKRGVFLSEYRTIKINSNSEEMVEMEKAVSWSELDWMVPPFLIFFHPQRTTDNQTLIL